MVSGLLTRVSPIDVGCTAMTQMVTNSHGSNMDTARYMEYLLSLTSMYGSFSIHNARIAINSTQHNCFPSEN